MDVLNDVLDTIDLKGTLYFRTAFSAPWSVQIPRLEQAARFHLVVQGRCHVQVNDEHKIELNPGDLVLIPYGAKHIISDAPVDQAPKLETVLEDNNYLGDGVLVVGEGDDDATTQLVCGHFDFRSKAEHIFIESLPAYIVVTSGLRAKHALLDDALRMITRGMFSDSFGTDAAIRRLSEIVFIELLRLDIGRKEALGPLHRALKDPKISHALQLIHTNPTAPWTLQTLAVEVAMSRSRFAERFKSLIGISPMLYLSEWRLQKALAMVANSGHTIQQVAAETGYKSPSSFSRAFQGKFGVAPKDYRQTQSSVG